MGPCPKYPCGRGGTSEQGRTGRTSPAGKPGGLCLSEPAFNLATVSFPSTNAWNIAPRAKGWFDSASEGSSQDYWALLLWPEDVAEKAVVFTTARI